MDFDSCGDDDASNLQVHTTATVNEDDDTAGIDFPLPLEETVEIRGIQLDKRLTHDDHFRDLLRRSQMRQAAHARVAN